jgi:hypothetical protein
VGDFAVCNIAREGVMPWIVLAQFKPIANTIVAVVLAQLRRLNTFLNRSEKLWPAFQTVQTDGHYMVNGHGANPPIVQRRRIYGVAQIATRFLQRNCYQPLEIVLEIRNDDVKGMARVQWAYSAQGAGPPWNGFNRELFAYRIGRQLGRSRTGIHDRAGYGGSWAECGTIRALARIESKKGK